MNNLISNSKNFIKRNSSTILTCVGIIGVAATAIVSAKDTVKALELLKKKEEETNTKLTKKETVLTAAPAYIPTALIALSTMTCVFGANVLNKRAQASIMSAYALLDQSYKEYRLKANEVYGEDADKRIKEAIAQNHYEDNDMINVEDDKELFFEFYGLQFFTSTMKNVINAENALNQMLENNGPVSLSLFYNLLGIECAETDYEIGWSINTCRSAGYDKIVFQHDKVKNDDGTEFWAISMVTEPVPDYFWF